MHKNCFRLDILNDLVVAGNQWGGGKLDRNYGHFLMLSQIIRCGASTLFLYPFNEKILVT